ncbi:hypothetical protein HDU76_012502 [Blyttiomyces sp. JEL0837]|nr:hypothetical protein HDU76_012502 [Blyttiomyces sp. JEL0837]
MNNTSANKVAVGTSPVTATTTDAPSPSTPNAVSSATSTDSHLTRQMDGMREEINRLEASLGRAADEKALIETSLVELQQKQKERADELDQKRRELRSGAEGAMPSSSDPLLAKVDEALLLGSSGDLQNVIKELRDRVVLQDAKSKKLAFELEMECGHVNILRAENQALKQQAVKFQAEAEREEEYIANKLMQRISHLKKEKGELLMKVEQEEEQITNALQRKLAQLQREKIEMEQALEQEQEFIVNRLQRQLESLRQQQSMSNSTQSLSKKPSGWFPSHTPPMSDFPPSPSISPGVLEVMKAEANALKMKIHDFEREYEENATVARDLYRKCKSEVMELRGKLGIAIEDLDTVYPSIMPPLVPHSPALGSSWGSLERSRDRSRGSLSHVAGNIAGSGVGMPVELGNWPRGERSSRSVSSTRGSLIL